MHILQAASSTYAGILVTIILTLRLAEAGYDQTLYPFGKDGTASAGGDWKRTGSSPLLLWGLAWICWRSHPSLEDLCKLLRNLCRTTRRSNHAV